MRVFVGADYRGFELKEAVLRYLAETEHEVTDNGCYEPDLANDFNDAAMAVSREVRENELARGILVCDSAHGMTIQANRFKGIRAAHCDSVESVILAREHDDANVLCLSGHFTSPEEARELVAAFLKTEFEPLERRVRRINRLDEGEDYD